MAQIHVCSQCQASFDSEEKYAGHVCTVTGFAPSQPENLGPEFESISKAALERGEARKQK